MEKATPTYIVVHGPPCSGKTLNSATLAHYFGCDAIFDDMPGPAGFVFEGTPTRVLWLCNHEHIYTKHAPDPNEAAYVAVGVAAALLGDRWVNPAL